MPVQTKLSIMAHQWRSYFTTHYNWDWVVQEAFGGIPDCKYCSRASELPSSTKGRREKYSLFRLDFVERCQDEHLSSGNIIRIRLDSPAMEGLDPKDLLFRHMERTKMSHFAPITQLVLWDTTEMSDIKPLPTNPAILKAPLGSGGFGLYFVYHPRDIMEVVTNHRRRAERYPSFLPNIIKSYGEFPLCWSIQEVIDPIHCRDPEAGDLRRSQAS